MIATVTTIVSCENLLHQLKVSGKIAELIDGIVSYQVIVDTAGSLGIKVETEELQQAVDQFRLMHELRSAEDTWNWLQKNYLSLDDLEEMTYRSVISAKLSQSLFADKVEPYFYEHQLDYARAILYEVVLEDEDLAMELFYALQENELSFYNLAHQYSQDIELRRSGGYLGEVYRSSLRAEISAAVFAAKPPEVLKPVVTAKGVHLILVEELIQPQLDEQLRYQIMRDLFSEWLKQQVKQVEVINNLELVIPVKQ